MLPIIIIAAVLALVWGTVLIQRGGLMGGCLATLTAGSCFGHAFLHFSVVTVDRLLLLLLGGLYVVFRQRRIVRTKPWTTADTVLAAWLGVLAICTFAHDWRMDGSQPLATLLFFFCMPAAFYWLARESNYTERHFRWLIVFLTGLGVYLSLTAFAEVMGWTSLVFPRYIASPQFAEFLGRARGPYLNPVCNGIFLSAGLAAAFAVWRWAGRARLAAAAAALVIGMGLACTLTRSVWLGAALMTLLALTLAVPARHRLPLLLGVMLLGAGGLAVSWDALSRFKRDKHVTVAEMAESASLRPILAAYAWEMFQDRPWLGFGLGQYRQASIDYRTQRTFDVPMDKAKGYIQHNVFLALLTETGLIGAGLYLLLLVLWSSEAWRLWAAAAAPPWLCAQGLFFMLLLAAYVTNGMFHDLLAQPMSTMLIFFAAGVTRAASAGEHPLAADSA